MDFTTIWNVFINLSKYVVYLKVQGKIHVSEAAAFCTIDYGIFNRTIPSKEIEDNHSNFYLNIIDSIECLLEREKAHTKTDQSPAGYWVLGNQLSPSEGRFCPGTCCLGTRDCQHSWSVKVKARDYSHLNLWYNAWYIVI